MAEDTFDLVELVTAAEVARALKVKRSTIYEAAATERIPCVKLWRGRKRALIRFRREDIKAFIRARTVGPVERSESL
jgi:excisionase family DNA binding protein